MSTKWGIAGTGAISHDFVNALSTYGSDSGHEVVAVAARNYKVTQDFALKHNIPKAYEGYQQLADDPDVSIVYIGVVDEAHLEVSALMINSGKHVLCEKPLTRNSKESKTLIDLARTKNLFLMEAIWSRCLPSYQKLKEELSNKCIGDIFSVNIQFGEVFPKELSSILSIGVYCIQLITLVFGQEKPLKILAGGHLATNGTDESVSATFIYKGGRTATFTTHTKVAFHTPASIYGTKGAISLQYPFWCAETIQTPTGTYSYPFPEATHPFVFLNSGGLRYEAQHARECIQKGLTESPLMSLDESFFISELMDQVLRQVGVQGY